MSTYLHQHRRDITQTFMVDSPSDNLQTHKVSGLVSLTLTLTLTLTLHLPLLQQGPKIPCQQECRALAVTLTLTPNQDFVIGPSWFLISWL